MFRRTTQCTSAMLPLQMFLFSAKILLGESNNVEATLNIRLEPTSISYFKYFINQDLNQKFQGLFFNKTITTIQLHYSYNGPDRNISAITFRYGENQYNGTFYSCQNFPNLSVIQCLKNPGSSDLLSEQCSHGTNILWNYKDEYFSSRYFINKTIKEDNDLRLICYTLVNNDTSHPDTTIYTSSNSSTGNSLTTVTMMTQDSSDLSSGVIVGIIISIVIVIIAIVILIVALRRRKYNKSKKATSISHIQSTDARNNYNQQAIETMGDNRNANAHFTSSMYVDDPYMEISNDRSQINNSYTKTEPDYVGIDKDYSLNTDIRLSTTEDGKDDYTSIEDTTEYEQGGSLDDGYSTLDQTIDGWDESVGQRKGRGPTGVPNYNNVDIQKADDIENLGRKKDDYSKLRERSVTFQDTYGELGHEALNGESMVPELESENENKNKEKQKRKDVYSKLREKSVHFENTYGELDQDPLNEDEIFLDLEVTNPYFQLENQDSNAKTVKI